MDEPVSEAFMEVIGLTRRLGVFNIGDLPGCWELDVDEHWRIVLNGHREPVAESKHGHTVAPYHCYVEFNGWPAGVFSPRGGWIAAGEAANERAFIEAVKRRTQ